MFGIGAGKASTTDFQLNVWDGSGGRKQGGSEVSLRRCNDIDMGEVVGS
jgi:hypothetical protein